VNPVLITVTLASVAVTLAALFYVWHLAREERERSAARVAALAADIDDLSPVATTASRPPDAFDPAFDPGRGPEPTPAGGLFASAPAERPALWRIAPALIAGIVIVGGLLASAVMLAGGRDESATGTATQMRPLELLSLRHEVQDASIKVTGLVRNAAPAAALDDVTAVVFLFDRDGGFLASARAPLDFPTLAPGEESPFVVSLEKPEGVARYRVSFRRSEGGTMPHVDRRETRRP
jgi:hypothetical protein